jgi:DNA-binding response OmpR family regulator
MKKTALVVEDEQRTLQGFAAVLRKSGWAVAMAENGKQALAELRSGRQFDIMLLDLRLPGMAGFDVVDKARSLNIRIPPVCVVSAYVDEETLHRLLIGKVAAVLSKPIDLESLPAVVTAVASRNETALVNIQGLMSKEGNLSLYMVGPKRSRIYLYGRRTDQSLIHQMHSVGKVSKAESLSDKIKHREEALVRHFRDRAHKAATIEAPEPLLIVARRWNSWYPSFFSVPGGAYAILGAKASDGSTRAALIDPGFRALEVLDQIGISVGCLNSCVITHNHADHVGGIFEYVSARHAAGKSTQVFCNRSVKEMLRSLAGSSLDVTEFVEDPVELVPTYTGQDGRQRNITATPLRTYHENIGDTQGTRGVTVTSEVSSREGHVLSRSTCVLLGDTEYHSDRRPFRKIRKALAGRDVKVAVLHIGSSQLKAQTGKHLYLPGLKDILKDVDSLRRKRPENHEDRLLVLISEWGLEHATAAQIAGALPGHAPKDLQKEFGSESPILETIDVMKSLCALDTITLLPADAGLVVGIESGKIYLDGVPANPQDVDPKSGKSGLSYHLKPTRSHKTNPASAS